MCRRYTITVLPSDLELWLNVKSPNTYKPRFNASPFQFLPIITNNNIRDVVMAHWGSIPGENESVDDSNPNLYLRSLNAVKSSKTLKKSILMNRCLILADGFYCWKTIGKNLKVPYRVVPNHKKLICFAGYWENSSHDNPNTHSISFKLITRPSYKPVHDISNTMPVIIESGKEMMWIEGKNMDTDKIIEMMEMEDWALLKYYSVSPEIENMNIDKPDLIKPAPATDQLGNLTLFD